MEIYWSIVHNIEYLEVTKISNKILLVLESMH